MRTALFPNPIRRAVLTLITCLLPASGLRAQSFSERIHRAPAPDTVSAGVFSGVTRWGGRLFLLYEAACFWSVDGERAWARQDFTNDGPKGSSPGLPGGWFARDADGIWLNSRDGALAWRFDPAAGIWRAWDAGAFVIAASGSGDRLYALTPDHRLRLTRNAGDTWGEIPLPPGVKDGTFFDDLLAEGEHLVLRARAASSGHPAAYTLDGGAHWAFLAPRTLPVLAHGRLYAFRDSGLAIYRPGAESLSRSAPPARAAFADSAGLLFALADSGMYALDPDEGSPWQRVADAGEMRGWSVGRDVLYRREGGILAWFDGLSAASDGVRPGRNPRATGRIPRFRFDPDGPAVPWIGMPGGPSDPLGRRIR